MSETNRYLDMTVFNRSNDLIWGMLGANVVHFSFLQEYMACCLGLDVGQYHQISNNLHIYTENNSGYKPDVWLAAHDTNEQYETAKVFNPIPLVQDKAVFDREVKLFVELNKNGSGLKGCELYKEPFLNNVAQPMMHAFHMHKQKDYDAAFHWVTRITQGDWKYAAATWLTKRKRIWENKNNPGQVTQGTDL